MAVFFDLAGVQGASFQIGLVDGAIINTSGLTAPRTFSLPDFGGQLLVGGFGMDLGDVAIIPRTTGGLLSYSVISSGAANQDSASIKGSAGQVFGYSLQNTTTGARYCKIYNKATAPTSGDTPIRRLYLPPGGGIDREITQGLACSLGIGIRITQGAADNDTVACAANDVLVNVDYK